MRTPGQLTAALNSLDMLELCHSYSDRFGVAALKLANEKIGAAPFSPHHSRDSATVGSAYR